MLIEMLVNLEQATFVVDSGFESLPERRQCIPVAGHRRAVHLRDHSAAVRSGAGRIFGL
jgi:hypothetical protein